MATLSNQNPRSYSNDVERFVYRTSRWDARLYDVRRTDGGSLDSAETEIRSAIYSARSERDFDSAEADSRTLGREVFARLYSDVERLDAPVGPEWASRVHGMLDAIDGFSALHDEIGGDPDLAALATGSLLSSVAGSLADLVRESESEDGSDSGDGSEGASGSGTGAAGSASGAPSSEDLARSALRSAIKTARRAVGEAREGLAGLAPGLGSAPAASEQVSDDRMRLAERLRSDDRIRDLIRRAGRIERIARSTTRSTTEGVSEVYDVTRGADVPRLLPSELAKLAHPALRALLLRDLAQRSAMQYALRSEEPLGRGPIVALLDVSGSMRGEPHDWTRAIGMALAGTARREKRSATIADFNGSVCRARRFERDGSAVDLVSGREFGSFVDAVLDVASASTSGGTSFDRALGWGLDRIVEAGDRDESRADLVVVTDGCDAVSDSVVEQMAALREQSGLRVFALTINGGAIDSNLAAVADEVLDLDSTGDVGETFAKAGWAR